MQEEPLGGVRRIYRADFFLQCELRLYFFAHVLEFQVGALVRPRGDVRCLVRVGKGAVLNGHCQMVSGGRVSSQAGAELMEVEEVARYLEVDSSVVRDWAVSGKLPAIREGDKLHFDKAKIDEWIASERVK